jgi:large subunit ribosomal protein L21
MIGEGVSAAQRSDSLVQSINQCFLKFSSTIGACLCIIPCSVKEMYGVQNMYAVIKTGGKQYRIQVGERLKVEQLEVESGSELIIDQVLMVADGEKISMGTPLVAGAKVSATVLGQGRHDKIRIFKMRRRKHYQKHQGHRQNYTEIQITGISA